MSSIVDQTQLQGDWSPVEESIYTPTVLDQTVGRYYVHRIFTFPFPQANKAASVYDASAYLKLGVKLFLKGYPMLSGTLQPTGVQNTVQVVYETSNIYTDKHQVSSTNFDWKVIDEEQDEEMIKIGSFKDMVAADMPVTALPAEKFCLMAEGDPSKEPVPVFSLRATFLKQSQALVLGFVVQHTLADGTALSTLFSDFVKALHLADGVPTPYNRPSIEQYISSNAMGSSSNTTMSTQVVVAPSSSQQTFEVDSPILKLTAAKIEEVKTRLNTYLLQKGILPARPLTKTDCLSGLCWVAVTRARATSASTPTYFRTAVNVRGKLDPPLPADYIGNMFAHATVAGTASSMFLAPELAEEVPVASTDLRGYIALVAERALEVRRAIDAVDDAAVRGRLSRVAQLDDFQDTAGAIPAFDKAHGLDFGSLALFGADLEFDIPGTFVEGDGRGGRPQFCRKVMPGKEGIANVLPRRDGTQGSADWELVVSLRKEHACKVVKELTRLGLLKEQESS